MPPGPSPKFYIQLLSPVPKADQSNFYPGLEKANKLLDWATALDFSNNFFISKTCLFDFSKKVFMS